MVIPNHHHHHHCDSHGGDSGNGRNGGNGNGDGDVLYRPIVGGMAPHDEDDDDDDQPEDDDNGVVVLEEEKKNQQQRLSPLAARLALFKGNLGPGILNLPHAFALINHPIIGSGLFAIIAIQGIYSMWLLVECQRYIRGETTTTTTTMDTTNTTRRRRTKSSTHPIPMMTYMDVARHALGMTGGRIVAVFLFVLQTGVCCVFLSLMATHLHVAAIGGIGGNGINNGTTTAILIVTLYLLAACYVWRDIKDLFWLNAIANLFMLMAICTAIGAGLIGILLRHNDGPSATATNPSSTSSSSTFPNFTNLIFFTSDMLYAFEGIGLVLPIENAYDTTTGTTDHHYHYRNNSDNAANASTAVEPVPVVTVTVTVVPPPPPPPAFSTILLQTMSAVAALFAITGVIGSLGFPIDNGHGNSSGSIIAYLHGHYPDVKWYGIVNLLVLIAVAMTFPLQLAPAVQVLDQWLLQSGCCRGCRRRDRNDVDRMVLAAAVHQQQQQQQQLQQQQDNRVDDTLEACCSRPIQLEEQEGGGGEENDDSPNGRHCTVGPLLTTTTTSTTATPPPRSMPSSMPPPLAGVVVVATHGKHDFTTTTATTNDDAAAAAMEEEDTFIASPCPCLTTTDRHAYHGANADEEEEEDRLDTYSDNTDDEIASALVRSTAAGATTTTTTSSYAWLWRRWGLVLLMTVIVLIVDNDVSLLMGLFGAVGQTGLAGMPCAIHLALQYQGRAPRHTLMSMVDVLILLLTLLVMVAGCTVSVRQIIVRR
jgi:Transmembrane amino acid transporter protein